MEKFFYKKGLEAKMDYLAQLRQLNDVSGINLIKGKMLTDRISMVCDSIEKDIGLIKDE